MPFNQVQELTTHWSITDNESVATAIVEALCPTNNRNYETSFHLYTLCVGDRIVPESFVGYVDDYELVYPYKRAIATANTESPPSPLSETPLSTSSGFSNISSSSEKRRESTSEASSNTLVDFYDSKDYYIPSEHTIDEDAELLTSHGIAFLRNNSLTVNSLKLPPKRGEVHPVSPFRTVQRGKSRHSRLTSPPKKLSEYFTSDDDSWDLLYNEHGSYQSIGRIVTHRGIHGDMLVAELGPGYSPGHFIRFRFQITQKSIKPGFENCNNSDPFQLAPWYFISIKTVPQFTDVMNVVIGYSAANIIAEVSPTCTLEKDISVEGVTLFRIQANSLTQVPLKRELGITLYQALAVKETKLQILRSRTVAKLLPSTSSPSTGFKLAYAIDFEAKILTPVNKPALEGVSLYSTISVPDGPVDKTCELCQKHRFISDCSVSLTDDQSVSYIQLLIPYNEEHREQPDVLKSLQLSFEKHYSEKASLIYIPRLESSSGREMISLLSFDRQEFKVDNKTWETVEPSSDPRYLTYINRDNNFTGENSGLVVYLLSPLPKKKDDDIYINRGVRDISYSLQHDPIDERISKISLEMNVVVNISQSTIGERILRVQSLDSWGYPRVSFVDNNIVRNGECSMEDDGYNVSIYRRSLSKKRDIEVKFLWTVRILNSPPTIFKGFIPYIANDTVANIRFASQSGLYERKIYGYVLPTNQKIRYYIKDDNGKLVIRSLNDTDQIYVSLSSINHKSLLRQKADAVDYENYIEDDVSTVISEADDVYTSRPPSFIQTAFVEFTKWIILVLLISFLMIIVTETVAILHRLIATSMEPMVAPPPPPGEDTMSFF